MQLINQETSPDPVEWGPLVLQLKNLRLWSGEQGLTQAELANIAGISPRLLRSYEACRALPHSVQAFLRLAVALRVPLEWLVEPTLFEELKATVEARRAVAAARMRLPAPRP